MAEKFKMQQGGKIQIDEFSDKLSVPIEIVSHIVGGKAFSIIYTIDNKTYMGSKNIGRFENELKKHGFEKANGCTLVNIKHISSVCDNNKRVITLSNNIEIKISRRRKYKFKQYMANR